MKIFLWSVIFICLCACNVQTDEQLLSNFHMHKDDFDTLITMFLEDDNVEKIRADFFLPQSAEISSSRLSTYGHFFEKLSINGIEGYGQKKIISIISSSVGISVSGSSKGYIYTTQIVEPIVDNLDKYYLSIKDSSNFMAYRAYRHIHENWYLYHLVDR